MKRSGFQEVLENKNVLVGKISHSLDFPNIWELDFPIIWEDDFPIIWENDFLKIWETDLLIIWETDFPIIGNHRFDNLTSILMTGEQMADQFLSVIYL